MCKDARLEGSGACCPRKFSEIRCSESEMAILGQKQRRIVATWLTEYCIQFMDAIRYMDLLSQLTSNFHKRKYTVGRTADGVKDGETVSREY